ncbi:MAG: AmmeMemoRadiSam system radical SAM enzyme, partial [Planctomycetaceae bacterium]
VLDTLKWLKSETDVWFEITNLVIPDANDKPDELRRMSDWILENVGDEVPVHFTAFHPDFRMLDRPRTPPETLNLARDIALETGLKYVYTGNVDDARRQSTYCPNCKHVVIERNWYELGTYALDGSRCRHCGHVIAGQFADRPGTWGRRRLPVDMRPFSQPRDKRQETRDESRRNLALDSGLSTLDSPALDSGLSTLDSPALDSGLSTLDSPTRVEQGDRTMSDATASAAVLSDLQQSVLLDAAARTIIAAAQKQRAPSDLLPSDLAAQPVLGTFVSLKRQGKLRSCCGSLGQSTPLAKSLRESAIRTATDDPRLPPISPSEFSSLDLEVWVLNNLQCIDGRGEARAGAVQVGRHGLQILRDDLRGLLLPSVAVEHGWDAEEFLTQTCIKAGLPPTAWKDDATTVLRFEGISCSRPLADGDTIPMPPLFPPREFAQYAQHARATIDTLLAGGVPMYYCPAVSDAEVTGVAVSARWRGAPAELIASRFSWKRSVPLQATIFSLCEDLARTIARGGLRPGEFDVDLLIAYDTAMHGTVAEPDLRGVEPARRALLVLQGNQSGLAFDRDASAKELLAAAGDACGVTEPHVAQVLSVAVHSTRDRVRIG